MCVTLTVEVEHAVLGEQLHGPVGGGAVGEQVEHRRQIDHCKSGQEGIDKQL